MTRVQVKQELRELKSIIVLNKCGIQAEDKKGLREKYEKVIPLLTHEEHVIFLEHIYNREPYWKIGLKLNYSEEGIRKKYNKLINKLADMFVVKKTNFDKITESVESLAEFIEAISIKDISKERIVKWLQEECNDE